jgi:hypothetical protein
MSTTQDPVPTPSQVWAMMHEASVAFASLLELGEEAFVPASLPAIDRFLEEHRPLDEEDVAGLGFFLARLLVEVHGGGLTRIQAEGHPLDGEWAVSGFESGIDADYHVPFMVSAIRAGHEGNLRLADWYGQVMREGHGTDAPRPAVRSRRPTSATGREGGAGSRSRSPQRR